MTRYAADALVSVYPFTRQIDGEQIVIGRVDLSVFLALPREAVTMLDDLAAGMRVGEVQQRYAAVHGEVPDIDDFLVSLEQEGFVLPGETTSFPPPADRKLVHFHFTGISQRTAQRLFSPGVLVGCAGVMTLAGTAVVLEPALIPNWRAHYFEHNVTVMRLGLLFVWYFAVFIHEMAHLLAARAVGVPARLGIGRRLWFWVAETDMTGMWSVPRQKRYLAYLAGPLVDAVSASLVILAHFADGQGWLEIPPGLKAFSSALLLTYFMSLLWQCYFFIQTDFYYVIAHLFNCKSLMDDTRTYITNQVAHWRRRGEIRDQSHIPESEMRVVRVYAWIWLAGRVIALGLALVVTLPLLISYLVLLVQQAIVGFHGELLGFLDVALMWILLLGRQGSAVYFFVRGYVEKWPVYIWLRRQAVSIWQWGTQHACSR
jgi:hypothetical protein